MKRLYLHLFIASIAIASAFAEDTIVFKNGDVLKGTILKQDEKSVHFKSGSVGTVNLNTEDIAEIRAETPKPDTTPATEPKQATTPEKAKAPSKWSGQTGLSIAMREKTDLNSPNKDKFEIYRLYGNVNWKGEKNNLAWNWSYRYSEDETKVRDDYLNVTQKYNHNFKGGYYAEAKTVYQHDYNRQIDNEYLQTAELGIKWIDRPPKLQFSTSIGGGYHQYERNEVTTKQPKLIFDESLKWQMINSLTLFQKYTHLSDFKKYHLIFKCGLENKLIQNLFLRLEYQLDRDTETTFNATAYNDKALLTSLLYKF
ncbi:MAG: DUF481 domain-containing protein [Verrucomicrobiota bacterium]